MSLNSLTNFWNNKSIKLSDSFVVLIKFKSLDNYEELYTCCGFTIPKIEYEEETLKYGNMEQIFLTPKYDSCKELTLEFFETWDNDGVNLKNKVKIKSACTLEKIFKYINLTIEQTYNDKIKTTNYGLYDSNMNSKIIDNITIKILDNKLKKYVYKYSFDNLKVINYTMYNLDYQNDAPCKVSVNLSFEGYNKQVIKENVNWPEKENSNDENATDENEKKNNKANNMNDAVDPPAPESSKTTEEVANEAIADTQKKKESLQEEFDKKANDYIGKLGNDKESKKYGKNETQIDAYNITMSDVNEKLAQFASGELSNKDIQEYRKELKETQKNSLGISNQGLNNALKTLDSGISKVQELNNEQILWKNAVDSETRSKSLQELEMLDDYELNVAAEQFKLEQEILDKQTGLNKKAEDDKRNMSSGRGADIGNNNNIQNNQTGGKVAAEAAAKVYEEAKTKSKNELNNTNNSEKRYRGITAEQLGKNAARQDLKEGNTKRLNYDIAMTQFIMGKNFNSTPNEVKNEMEKFERGYSSYIAEHGTDK